MEAKAWLAAFNWVNSFYVAWLDHAQLGVSGHGEGDVGVVADSNVGAL